LSKLYNANVKWIEDIIEIVLENVSCDHQIDSNGAGKSYDSVSYSLNYEEDVIKRCIEAIPEVPLIESQLQVTDELIEEKAREIHRITLSSDICNYKCSAMTRIRDFIRSFIKELEQKIKREMNEAY